MIDNAYTGYGIVDNLDFDVETDRYVRVDFRSPLGPYSIHGKHWFNLEREVDPSVGSLAVGDIVLIQYTTTRLWIAAKRDLTRAVS